MQRIILGITGASGTVYAVEFVKLLKGRQVEVHAVISAAGEQVMRLETGLSLRDLDHFVHRWYARDDFAAPIASGSARFDAMVVLPCTMGTLGAIANGISRNLIHRAADVTLKEGRPLVLAVRETPFNRIHLTNMLQIVDAGGVILPCMPAFYHRPGSIEELARQFAARVCDQLGIVIPGVKRWGGEAETGERANGGA